MNIQVFNPGVDDPCRTFHCDRRISSREFRFDSLEAARHCPAPNWVLAIFELPGVERVDILQHGVVIHKADLFPWLEITDQAVAIIRQQFGPEVRP